MTSDLELIEIGIIAKPQGVHGAVKVKTHNPDSELLETSKRVWVGTHLKSAQAFSIDRVQKTNKPGIWIVQFDTLHTVEQAEKFRAKKIYFSKHELPKLQVDEFYLVDIKSAVVIEEDGSSVGKVIDVCTYPTLDCFRIENADEVFEIPYTDRYIKDIQVSSGVMYVKHTDELPKEKRKHLQTKKDQTKK